LSVIYQTCGSEVIDVWGFLTKKRAPKAHINRVTADSKTPTLVDITQAKR